MTPMTSKVMKWAAHVELSSAVVVCLAFGVLLGDIAGSGALKINQMLGLACALVCAVFGVTVIRMQMRTGGRRFLDGFPFTLTIALVVAANIAVAFNLFAYPIITLLFQAGTLIAVVLVYIASLGRTPHLTVTTKETP